jgi:hypothetical protein
MCNFWKPGVGASKKQKKAPMALENIVKKCIPVFLQYRSRLLD